MNYTTITKQLIKHEGLRLKPYHCTAGKLTIGVGRNLEDKGLSEEEVMILLEHDVFECAKDLVDIFPEFERYPENIQLVLADMRFQLGPNRFRGFKLMVRAVKNQNWPEMIKQMKDSVWYGQTPNRANNLIRMVKEVV